MNTKEITSDSTMREVLEVYPGAQRALMRRYHIGGCSHCGFAPEDRLADVLTQHNVLNVDQHLEHTQRSHAQGPGLHSRPPALAAALKGRTPPALLDVRSQEERAIVKLDGSLHATQNLTQEMMSSWPKDTPIVTYCHHGIRSLEAASDLIGHGFTNGLSLTGGIDAWAEEIDTALRRY